MSRAVLLSLYMLAEAPELDSLRRFVGGAMASHGGTACTCMPTPTAWGGARPSSGFLHEVSRDMVCIG